ncbi:MAG: serine/threonine-protein kinase, partial [Thermoanaerobaculia bacterium]
MHIRKGSLLGPYEIVAPIGAGGMGEVWKARDTRLDRSVAIKILPPGFATDAKMKIRFEREARTISRLEHPNICRLYDVGEAVVDDVQRGAVGSPGADGTGLLHQFLVMELLDGESLAERIAKGPLPIADVLRYGAEIGDALHRAHIAGVVHRDLKPGNVMITKSGAKLLDFGLAKRASSVVDSDGVTLEKSLTEEGTIVGTFQYMAPEQLDGEEPDARTDIFALGAVLYEMATGRRAFESKTKPNLIAAIMGGTPLPMSELQPLTLQGLEHIVGRCLEKERDRRWQSASDVAAELRWIAHAVPGVPAAPRRG